MRETNGDGRTRGETEKRATKTAKSVFLVSALVWRRFCGCRCNGSKEVSNEGKASSLERRFVTVEEGEEKKILKRTNDESG